MDRRQALFKAIQSMHEDNFSKEIIIPLFQRMGYSFTDFYGGVYEQGRDVIASKKDEIDDLEVTVIQSKMLKTIKTAESSQRFSEIIYQLRHCLTKKVPCVDGIERLPYKVYFITPFDIDTRGVFQGSCRFFRFFPYV